jgi:hypothetical protein
MSAYNEVYVSSVMKAQGKMFLKIRDKLPGVDEKWYIEAYMQSNIRSLVDEGNIKYVNAPSTELMLRFIEDECGGQYKRGAEWGGFIPEWAGKIYALYQWKYSVQSKNLISRLPLDEIERIFPVLHQAGWEAAVDKIHDSVII